MRLWRSGRREAFRQTRLEHCSQDQGRAPFCSAPHRALGVDIVKILLGKESPRSFQVFLVSAVDTSRGASIRGEVGSEAESLLSSGISIPRKNLRSEEHTSELQ